MEITKVYVVFEDGRKEDITESFIRTVNHNPNLTIFDLAESIKEVTGALDVIFE